VKRCPGAVFWASARRRWRTSRRRRRARSGRGRPRVWASCWSGCASGRAAARTPPPAPSSGAEVAAPTRPSAPWPTRRATAPTRVVSEFWSFYGKNDTFPPTNSNKNLFQVTTPTVPPTRLVTHQYHVMELRNNDASHGHLSRRRKVALVSQARQTCWRPTRGSRRAKTFGVRCLSTPTWPTPGFRANKVPSRETRWRASDRRWITTITTIIIKVTTAMTTTGFSRQTSPSVGAPCRLAPNRCRPSGPWDCWRRSTGAPMLHWACLLAWHPGGGEIVNLG